mmetsp:Transcript_9952/g.25662  ORF Transcript_9952/g.25662 Transcript_9952/m.25662 type:complete len:105 (-) Transcript_9952:4298-4612(-)|eukprot:1156505-Pelagomonas_calceolata.AAC.1
MSKLSSQETRGPREGQKGFDTGDTIPATLFCLTQTGRLIQYSNGFPLSLCKCDSGMWGIAGRMKLMHEPKRFSIMMMMMMMMRFVFLQDVLMTCHAITIPGHSI